MSFLTNSPVLAPSGFLPDSISSLRLWLRSDEEIYSDSLGSIPQTTNGGGVRYWGGKSGKSYARRYAPGEGSPSGNPPTLDTVNTVNGIQTVRFTQGTNQWMSLDHAGIIAGSTSGELFRVIKLVADPPGFASQTGLDTWGLSNFGTNYPWTDGIIYEGAMTDTRKTCGNPALSLATWHVSNVYSAPSDWALLLNNSVLFSTAVNTPRFNTGSLLGVDWGISVYFNGWAAEYLWFNAKLSSTERGNVYSYLSTRYGI